MPVIHAAADTSMNSVVLVAGRGHAHRAGRLFVPATAMIQLPNCVRINSHEPTAAKMTNDSTTTPNCVWGHLSSPSVPTLQIFSSSLPVTNSSRVTTLSMTAPMPTDTRARPTPSSRVKSVYAAVTRAYTAKAARPPLATPMSSA